MSNPIVITSKPQDAKIVLSPQVRTISSSTVSKTNKIVKGIFSGFLGIAAIGTGLPLAFIHLPLVVLLSLAINSFGCLFACGILARSANREQPVVITTQSQQGENLLQQKIGPKGEENKLVMIGDQESLVYKPNLLKADYFRSPGDFIFKGQSFRQKYKKDFDHLHEVQNQQGQSESAEVLKEDLSNKMFNEFLVEVQRNLGPNRQQLIPKITRAFCQNSPLFIKNQQDARACQQLAEGCVDRAIAKMPQATTEEERAQYIKEAIESTTMIKSTGPISTRVELIIPEDIHADVVITVERSLRYDEVTTLHEKAPQKIAFPISCKGTVTFILGTQDRQDQITTSLLLSEG